MNQFTVDAVAMTRYLVDRLPPAADDVFRRGELGNATLEAPPVTISEALWTAVNKGTIARVDIDTTSEAVLDGLVRNGPIRMVEQRPEEVALAGELIGRHSLHDALLIASHRARDTDVIVTNDDAFDVSTVWADDG